MSFFNATCCIVECRSDKI
ncbi:hypothetical protein D043_2390A, partial [Vibrio parahaemolyticus EKP-021]